MGTLLQQDLASGGVLGVGAPTTIPIERLAAAGTLANPLVGQGQYFEAEEMLFEVLAVKKRALGADPADTLATANYLVRLQKKVIHLFYFFSNQTWLHSRHQRITV